MFFHVFHLRLPSCFARCLYLPQFSSHVCCSFHFPFFHVCLFFIFFMFFHIFQHFSLIIVTFLHFAFFQFSCSFIFHVFHPLSPFVLFCCFGPCLGDSSSAGSKEWASTKKTKSNKRLFFFWHRFHSPVFQFKKVSLFAFFTFSHFSLQVLTYFLFSHVFHDFLFSFLFFLHLPCFPAIIVRLENCWWWLWMKWSRTCWPCTDKIWRRTAANAQREIRNVITLCAETLMDPLSQPTRCFVHRKCFPWPAVTFLKTDKHGQQGLWMFCLLDGSDYNMFYVAGRVSDVCKTLCVSVATINSFSDTRNTSNNKTHYVSQTPETRPTTKHITFLKHPKHVQQHKSSTCLRNTSSNKTQKVFSVLETRPATNKH